MKRVFALKIGIDIFMTLLLPVMMVYNLTGNLVHEILGVLLFILFIAHHILNRGWVKRMHKGHGGIPGMLHTVANCLLFISMIAMGVSSIMVSRDVFAFLRLDSGLDARKLHVCTCTWGFVFMGIHLGFHLHMVASPLLHAMEPIPHAAKKFVLRIIASAVTAFGMFASFTHDIGSKLIMYYGFSYWDPDRNALPYLFEPLAIIGMYACTTHYVIKVAMRCPRE
jgi:hypothetical protein